MTTKRDFLAGGAAAAALATTGMARAATAGFSDADYARAVVINGLSGLDDPDERDPKATRLSPTSIAQLKASGLTALVQTVNQVGNAPDVWDKTITYIAQIDQIIAENADIYLKATSAEDIRRAKREGKVAIVYDAQDTSMIGTALDRLALLRGLGVRIVQLTYNLRNLSGDGSLEPDNAGLSKLGRTTIARIEHEKLLLDFAHAGQRTTAEGLAAATRPPMISHTGCRALNDNPRNVGDAEMKACADKGGVVGIYWMPFLVANSKPTGADLVRHMQHALNICGEDHVGIGTDGGLAKTVIDDKARAIQKAFYDGRAAQGVAAPGEGPDIFNIVAEWDDHLRFRHLADGLARAGWSSRQIEKALGGNLLRLYGETFG